VVFTVITPRGWGRFAFATVFATVSAQRNVTGGTVPPDNPEEGVAMSYLTATMLTFTPGWDTMDDDERTAEQVAAYEIVSKFGGEIKAQYILWSDNCLLAVTEYPDEISAMKSELAIGRRGAFVLKSQRAVPLEDVLSWQDEIKVIAGR